MELVSFLFSLTFLFDFDREILADTISRNWLRMNFNLSNRTMKIRWTSLNDQNQLLVHFFFFCALRLLRAKERKAHNLPHQQIYEHEDRKVRVELTTIIISFLFLALSFDSSIVARSLSSFFFCLLVVVDRNRWHYTLYILRTEYTSDSFCELSCVVYKHIEICFFFLLLLLSILLILLAFLYIDDKG